MALTSKGELVREVGTSLKATLRRFIRRAAATGRRTHRETVDFFQLDDWSFYQRFRFDKDSVKYLVEEFGVGLGSETNHYPASAETKMLVALRFLASK